MRPASARCCLAASSFHRWFTMWRIGFNTNHYMRSHMRGRGAGAKPLRKKWVQHPIYRTRFETARSKPSLASRSWASLFPEAWGIIGWWAESWVLFALAVDDRTWCADLLTSTVYRCVLKTSRNLFFECKIFIYMWIYLFAINVIQKRPCYSSKSAAVTAGTTGFRIPVCLYYLDFINWGEWICVLNASSL